MSSDAHRRGCAGKIPGWLENVKEFRDVADAARWARRLFRETSSVQGLPFEAVGRGWRNDASDLDRFTYDLAILASSIDERTGLASIQSVFQDGSIVSLIPGIPRVRTPCELRAARAAGDTRIYVGDPKEAGRVTEYARWIAKDRTEPEHLPMWQQHAEDVAAWLMEQLRDKSAPDSSAADNGLSTTRKAESLEEYVGGNIATLTIVFTDIVGSVEMKETLGDYEYGSRRKAHVQQAELLLAEHRGHRVKWVGDCLLAVFKANEHALDFALALLRNTGHDSIQLRIGIHVGSTGIEDHDVSGSTVDYAKRVQGKASASSLFVSDLFKNEIVKIGRPEHRILAWERHDVKDLKGIPGNHTLWEVAESSQ